MLPEMNYYTVSAVYNIPYGHGTGIFMSRDGEHLVTNNRDYMQHRSLSTPFSLASMPITKTLNAYPSTVSPDMLRHCLSPDGVFLFTSDWAGAYGTIFRFTLSTPWDISAIVPGSRVSFALPQAADEAFLTMYISTDGSKLYTSKQNGDIFQFSMSTSFDITTLAFDYYVGLWDFLVIDTPDYTLNLNPSSYVFSDDGFRLYGLMQNSVIVEIVLSTAWDIRTYTSFGVPYFPYEDNGLWHFIEGLPDVHGSDITIGATNGELLFSGYNGDTGFDAIVKITGTPLPGPSPSQFWTNFSGQTEIV